MAWTALRNPAIPAVDISHDRVLDPFSLFLPVDGGWSLCDRTELSTTSLPSWMSCLERSGGGDQVQKAPPGADVNVVMVTLTRHCAQNAYSCVGDTS